MEFIALRFYFIFFVLQFAVDTIPFFTHACEQLSEYNFSVDTNFSFDAFYLSWVAVLVFTFTLKA